MVPHSSKYICIDDNCCSKVKHSILDEEKSYAKTSRQYRISYETIHRVANMLKRVVDLRKFQEVEFMIQFSKMNTSNSEEST
jgi:hypothetical protein